MDLQNIQENTEIQFIDSLTKPKEFEVKIMTLKETLPHILDDYKKYYVFHHINPEYGEYQQMFENIKNNLHKENSDLSDITNKVDKNNEDINKKLIIIDRLIRKEKEQNKMLKKKLGILHNEYNGSDEMINNFKYIYNENYLTNWSLFIGSLITVILIMSLFNQKGLVPIAATH